MKLRAWLMAVLIAIPSAQAQDDLPKRAPGKTFDFEPSLMLDGTFPASPHASPSASPETDIEQLETALGEARQRATASEQLVKDGVLAKVEAEARAMQVIQIQKQLADARLALAENQAGAAKTSFDAHKATQAALDAANLALKAAQDSDNAAAADWMKAQLDAATLDVKRKRKLYSEGVGSKLELEMAEQRLDMLTGTTPQTPSSR